jgi:hypothetical protein
VVALALGVLAGNAGEARAQATDAFQYNEYLDAASGGVRKYPRWATDPTAPNTVNLEKAVGTLKLPGGNAGRAPRNGRPPKSS